MRDSKFDGSEFQTIKNSDRSPILSPRVDDHVESVEINVVKLVVHRDAFLTTEPSHEVFRDVNPSFGTDVVNPKNDFPEQEMANAPRKDEAFPIRPQTSHIFLGRNNSLEGIPGVDIEDSYVRLGLVAILVKPDNRLPLRSVDSDARGAGVEPPDENPTTLLVVNPESTQSQVLEHLSFMNEMKGKSYRDEIFVGSQSNRSGGSDFEFGKRIVK